jgi:hypothetical protein
MAHKALLIVFTVAIIFAASSALAPKKLAGPPEEITHMRMPDPSAAAKKADNAMFYVWFDSTADNRLTYTLPLPVDSSTAFAFSFYFPHDNLIELSLQDPNGNQVDLEQFEIDDNFFGLGDSGQSVPARNFVFEGADVVVGQWILQMKSVQPLHESLLQKFTDNTMPNAIVVLFNDNEIKVTSQMISYDLKVGGSVGLLAKVDPVAKKAMVDAGFSMQITTAKMDVILPDGENVDIDMHDESEAVVVDGTSVHAEKFVANIEAKLTGSYVASANVKGFIKNVATGQEVEFVRSTSHLVSVAPADVNTLAGSAWIDHTSNMRDEERVLIRLDLNGQALQDYVKYRAYAEVYGTDKDGNLQPACWLGGMSEVNTASGLLNVALELNLKWLARLNLQEPIVLKNVYIADTHSNFPLSQLNQINVALHPEITIAHRVSKLLQSRADLQVITKEMREGVNPLKKAHSSSRSVAPTLMMLHGYCVTENPWLISASNFTNAAYFLDVNGNIPNDKFAQLIDQFAKKNNMDRYSIIAHSQGGLAALHLHNFYFCGLDNAEGGRLIQTVGSPYRGSKAAGFAATLGSIFGVGCGSNNDLSRDGAVIWLSGISMENRKDVYYHTTTYKQGNALGDYCSLATNLVLDWPNDGVTEFDYAKLDGGNYMGNDEKWCHTTEMAYPAQYSDTERNLDMDANAAR